MVWLAPNASFSQHLRFLDLVEEALENESAPAIGPTHGTFLRSYRSNVVFNKSFGISRRN